MRSYTSIKRGLPEKIFELRNKGLSYGKIAKQLRKYKLRLPRLPEGYLNDVTQVTQS